MSDWDSYEDSLSALQTWKGTVLTNDRRSHLLDYRDAEELVEDAVPGIRNDDGEVYVCGVCERPIGELTLDTKVCECGAPVEPDDGQIYVEGGPAPTLPPEEVLRA